MLWCLILIGAYLTRLSRNTFSWIPGQQVTNLHGTDFEQERVPGVLRDAVFEQSFAARPKYNIRLPHGPSNQVKHIENFKFFDNERFRKNYQANLHTAWIENNNWQLDVTQKGIMNGFAVPHDPEDNYRAIANFGKRSALRFINTPGTRNYFVPEITNLI